MDFREKFLLHWLVWENDYRQLEREIHTVQTFYYLFKFTA